MNGVEPNNDQSALYVCETGFLHSCEVRNLRFVFVNMSVLFLEHQDSADGEK